MRVLFSSTAGHGHVYPLVPLARAFADAGHDVLWAGHGDIAGLVEGTGLATAPAGLQGAQLAEVTGGLRQQARALPPKDRAAFMYPNGFGSALAPPMARDLLPLAQAWRPDLLVHEQGELASPLVGAVLGVPSVMQSFGGAIPAELVTEAGVRLAPLWHEHGLAIPPYAGCFEAPFLDICPPTIRPVSLSHVPVVHELRPVPYAGREQAPPPGLDGSEPLVYVTLGTIPGATATLRATVAALAALPVRILVTVGPEADPDALGPQPGHITVTRFAPQTQVLPRCAVVVSHGGSGTFLGALAHGVPQLCLPQAADQFRNAAACLRSGAGLALDPQAATPQAIADAVVALLEGDTFRVRAAGVRGEVEAMPAPPEVVALLEAFIDA